MAIGRIRGNAYFIDGKEVTKEEFNLEFPDKPISGRNLPGVLSNKRAAWPRKSDALGVHPKQKQAAEKQAADLGVPTEFDGKSGQAIIRDNAHQRSLMKALHVHNNDGGYGSITG